MTVIAEIVCLILVTKKLESFKKQNIQDFDQTSRDDCLHVGQLSKMYKNRKKCQNGKLQKSMDRRL